MYLCIFVSIMTHIHSNIHTYIHTYVHTNFYTVKTLTSFQLYYLKWSMSLVSFYLQAVPFLTEMVTILVRHFPFPFIAWHRTTISPFVLRIFSDPPQWITSSCTGFLVELMIFPPLSTISLTGGRSLSCSFGNRGVPAAHDILISSPTWTLVDESTVIFTSGSDSPWKGRAKP